MTPDSMPAMTAPRIAFLASPADEAQAALAQLVAAHGQHEPEEADVIVRARRRRLHAADAAPARRPRQAGVRHEAGHRRLPDEPLSRRRRPADRAHRRGRARRAAAAGNGGADRIGRHRRLARLQRSLAAAADAPGRAPARSTSTASRAWTNWSATACWSPRPPAAPPTTSPRTARSCRWARA